MNTLRQEYLFGLLNFRITRAFYQLTSYLLAGLGVCLSSVANADFEYNYLQASYVIGEFEQGSSDVNFKGYELAATFELMPSLAVGISHLSIEGEDIESSVTGEGLVSYEGDGIEAFITYYSPVSVNADFLLGARTDMREFEAQVQGEVLSIQSKEETNFAFTGLRYQLSGLEINGQWSYNLDADDDEDRWSYSVGLLSGTSGQWQLGLSLSPDNTGDVLRAFVRHAY